MSRRLLAAVVVAGCVAATALASSGQAPASAGDTGDDPWARLPGILARIQAPVFPGHDFPIDRFGAVSDGRTIHPVLSRNVVVRGVTILSAGPNNDGCDPESSTDVLIEDATFDTGDDCIAIKSGRDADGRRLAAPSERIVVRGCRMRAGHGGVTIGSEVSGSVRDVFVERSSMSSPRLERGIRVKTNATRGGTIENVFVRDVEIGAVGSAVDVDMAYEEGAAGAFVPVVRNLRVERLTVGKARYPFFIRGLQRSPATGLSVRDSVFHDVAEGSRLEHVEELVLRNVVLEPAATRE